MTGGKKGNQSERVTEKFFQQTKLVTRQTEDGTYPVKRTPHYECTARQVVFPTAAEGGKPLHNT